MTAMIWLLSIPSMSKALAVTRIASVESSPPEIPTTALLAWVWASLFFRPMAWMVRISSHLLSLSSFASGTNGLEGNFLVSLVSVSSSRKGTLAR